MKTFVERVEDEKEELEKKIESLYKFIEYSETFKTLDEDHKDLLTAQLKTMKRYAHILKMRLLMLKE